MRHSLVMLSGVLTAWAVLCGCSRQPPAPTSTVTWYGYTIVFDGQFDGPFSHNGHRNSTRGADGKEAQVEEEITATFGTHTAKIQNGKLTAEGKDRGAVKPGDTIRLTPAGRVFVNDVER